MENEQLIQGQEEQTPSPRRGNRAVEFLRDIIYGVAIGIAFIIPGFSGGSVAAILGIYERLVGAIADIFKHFKRSFLTLLPILLGMLLGIAALILPIQWGLKNFPIPTVSLFVGLAIGGLPSITDKLKGGKAKISHLGLCVAAFLVAVAFSLPSLFSGFGEVDLFNLSAGGYLLLVLVGMVGSAALVVPGISGSMLLLILGYYNPVVELVTLHLLKGDQIGHCLLVVLFLAIGVAAGFVLISKLMKFFLNKFPRGTYFTIFGFVLGSIPAVYISTMSEATEALTALYASPWYWIVAVALLCVGFALSFALVQYVKRKNDQRGDHVTSK